MTDNLLKSQAFKIKGRLYTLTVLQILEVDVAQFGNYLSEVITKAPKLFENTPMVLDFTAVEQEHIDLQAYCQQLRAHHILPVAIQGGDARLQTIALANGLALIGGSSAQDKILIQDLPLTSERQSVAALSSKVVTTPVRSGQQVVSKGGDLIVVASVSHGAELLADGHIHVYGALRGRALAGIDGNKDARIFCQSLDAELVSIAGCYRLRDAIEAPNGPCQLFLKDDHIHIEPL